MSQVSHLVVHLFAMLGADKMWIANFITICFQFESRLGIAAKKGKRKSTVKRWCPGYACETSSVFVGLINNL